MKLGIKPSNLEIFDDHIHTKLLENKRKYLRPFLQCLQVSNELKSLPQEVG